MKARVAPFIAVGAIGFVLQMTALAWLLHAWHWPYLASTIAAVEIAVLHNFVWHERWTWADRHGVSGAAMLFQRLFRFHLGTGFTSIAGNVIVMTIAVELFHVPALAANAIAVGVTSIANFLISDRWVFTAPAVVVLAAAVIVGAPGVAIAAEPRPETVAAWNRHVAQVEAHLEAVRRELDGSPPSGRSIGIPGGTIHEWRGTITLRGLTVARLVHALEDPGLPPPAEDILDARVLARTGPDTLRVYMKLARSAIVTVTYDTEHDVTFNRVSPGLATSRSVSTSIREVDGSDRGFLWRLNSYWEYRQAGSDVVVDVLSLSLSRGVPGVVRPVAGPIINRIARDSMRRTLDAVQQFGEKLARGGAQERGARTSTPAAPSPARIHAAMAAAPGVSP
jgi:putative flippase GtrA